MEEFREKRDKKYLAIIRSWDDNWAKLTTFFKYPGKIRHLVYTTNAVEAYHRMVRKFNKAKAIFPTDVCAGLGHGIQSIRDILPRSYECIGQRVRRLRMSEFIRLRLTGEAKTDRLNSLPIHRISRSKRRVALHCNQYY